MPRTIAALVATILLIAACEKTAPPGAEKKEQPKTLIGAASSVDAQWLERALHYERESDAAPLVKEFAKAHPSQALPPDAKFDSEPYLHITTANLDEDPEQEHLLFIGEDPAHTMLYVIDRRGAQQEIIFNEYIDMFNEEPELHIVDQGQRSKLFYIRMLQERGSGVWLFTYRFYRMVQGAVYDVLDIVQASNLALEPSDLYQNARSVVQGAPEGVRVNYTFQFSSSMRVLLALGIANDYSEEKEVALIDDEESVLYAWDGASRKLVPRLQNSKLSEMKIRCFSKLGDEVLFASAFENELRKLAGSGSADQKKVAEYLLKNKKKE